MLTDQPLRWYPLKVIMTQETSVRQSRDELQSVFAHDVEVWEAVGAAARGGDPYRTHLLAACSVYQVAGFQLAGVGWRLDVGQTSWFQWCVAVVRRRSFSL